MPTAQLSSTSRSQRRRQPTRYAILLASRESSVLCPPPPASLGTWPWASSVQSQGWVTGGLWPAASEHALCWGVMELFQSMTPFVLSISFSSFKYLSDFPVLCCNAKQVSVEEHAFTEIVLSHL